MWLFFMIFAFYLTVPSAAHAQTTPATDNGSSWEILEPECKPDKSPTYTPLGKKESTTISKEMQLPVPGLLVIPKDCIVKLWRSCGDSSQTSSYKFWGPGTLSLKEFTLELLSPIKGTHLSSCPPPPTPAEKGRIELVFPQGIVGTRGTEYEFVSSSDAGFFVMVKSGEVILTLRLKPEGSSPQPLTLSAQRAAAVDLSGAPSQYDAQEANYQLGSLKDDDAPQNKSFEKTSDAFRHFLNNPSGTCSSELDTLEAEVKAAPRPEPIEACYALYLGWRCASLQQNNEQSTRLKVLMQSKCTLTSWASLLDSK